MNQPINLLHTLQLLTLTRHLTLTYSQCISVCICFSGRQFPAFEVNTERYRVSSIQSEYSVRMRQNTDHKNSKYGHFSVIFNLPVKTAHYQKQPSRAVLRKRCSENMQQIYRRTLMSKCRSAKHWCSPINLLHIFTIPFSKNMFEGLLLSLPDGKEKGIKVDILVGIQSR